MVKTNIASRIQRIEQILQKHGREHVLVTFQDGSTRKMKAPDAIPLLQSPDSIVDVCGESGGGNGLLVELERGLIQE